MIEKVREDRTETNPGRPLQTVYFALLVAAVANVLIPAVVFGDKDFFGGISLRYRGPVIAAVAAEYLIAFLLLRLHANVGFAAGYAAATSAVVTLGSIALTWTVLRFSPLDSIMVSTKILSIAAFAFAVMSNTVFFAASARFARFVHPRLHLGGFIIGVMACLAVLLAYMHILPLAF